MESSCREPCQPLPGEQLLLPSSGGVSCTPSASPSPGRGAQLCLGSFTSSLAPAQIPTPRGDGFSSHSLPGATGGQIPPEPSQAGPSCPQNPQWSPAGPSGTPKDPSLPLPLQLHRKCWNRSQTKPKEELAGRKPPGADPSPQQGRELLSRVWDCREAAGIPGAAGLRHRQCLVVALAAQVAVLAVSPPGPPSLAGFVSRE